MPNESRMKILQENRIRNGRGQGIGSDYTPFIQAHDNKVASEGYLTRHLGWKTKRIHHTLSEHERRYLYYLEWLDEVVDIREQFPLLPIERTQEIADQLGIKHAHYQGVPVVMTTDFMITLNTPNGYKDVVRTVKPANKLTKRTLELFEIERRFFTEQGIDWCIILDNKLPKNIIKNVEWMSEAKYLETRPSVDEELVNLLNKPLFNEIIDNNGSSISKICLRCDENFGIETGTSMFILKHMLALKRWGTDINVPIKDSRSLQLINLANEFVNTKLG
ncbi:TnsA endonuclease N-terminal domain-containing protein [Priestia koreensis]|uniref:TnsA endonuclease N-terminal domain-containing protein n=1 Tax=Priestia koreensis TaxID=284581 RepID=UPI00203DDDC2|nr:TnsA endonuclease N-terminal domain-containing protein [Priestia koreensis]MCM3006711.1 TnsA endonuclease N-terminal domain-containing protein [Priestia koreensis]